MIDLPVQHAIRRDAEEIASRFPALMAEAERIAHTVASGLHGRRRSGPGETFWQHRPYSFGDPVTAIDWRQSARNANRLYVRENEWETAASIYLWRDPSKSLQFSSSRKTPTKRRRSDVLAVALSILLSRSGERVGLLGKDRRPFHGRIVAARILDALSQEQSIDSAPPVTAPPRGSKVVMLSDFYTNISRVEKSVTELATAGSAGVLIQICDIAEETFPFSGRVEFKDLESQDRITFGDTSAIAKSYRDKFLAHRATLEDIARRFGWTFIAHRTDKPAQLALLALFSAIGEQTGRVR